MSTLLDADPEVEARRRAVLDLRTAQGSQVEESFFEALADADWRVRKEAVGVAPALAERVALLPGLLDAIAQTENVGLRNAALEVVAGLGARAADEVHKGLSTVSPVARKFVIAALGEVAGPGELGVLIRALDDSDPNVVAAALEGVAQVGGAEAEKALRARLRSSDPFTKIAVLDGLDRMRAKVPFEDLETLLEDSLLRKVALHVVGRSADPRSVAPALEALGDQNPSIVGAAAIALCRLHDARGEVARTVEEALRSLSEEGRASARRILRQGDPVARQSCARVLLLARDEEAVEGVVELASHDALPVKELLVLRAWGEACVPALLRVHDENAGKIRAVALELAADVASAAQASGKVAIVAEDVHQRLREGLSASDSEIRLRAARAMLEWATGEDASALIMGAGSPDAELSRACALALDALAERDQDAVRESLKPIQLGNPGTDALTSIVARVSGAAVIDQMREALASESPAARTGAIEGLRLIGGTQVVNLIGLGLADPEPEVRAAAARALGDLRDPTEGALGIGRLEEALASPDPTVVAVAAVAFGRARGPKAKERLIGLLGHEHPEVVISALEGLTLLGDPSVLGAVAPSVGVEDSEVAKQALIALSDLGADAGSALDVTEAIAGGLRHPAWDVRQLAAILLGDCGGVKARRILESHLRSETYDLVRDAVNAALALLDQR
ncbi:MAG: HEAT repeat domain-containing protein [Myxococcales bacterium]|nr:HEAT repeat domain-containing protein [Myxococcales bacterium]